MKINNKYRVRYIKNLGRKRAKFCHNPFFRKNKNPPKSKVKYLLVFFVLFWLMIYVPTQKSKFSKIVPDKNIQHKRTDAQFFDYLAKGIRTKSSS